MIVPSLPHHVTQRGNRGTETFLREKDYDVHIALMAEGCGRRDMKVWAYCLTPNYVRLMAVPTSEDSLARDIAGEQVGGRPAPCLAVAPASGL